MTDAYDARDLVKTYKSGKVRALDGVSFRIEEGEIFGLLGPNGAGKSTLVGLITGLLRPDSGTLLLHGNDIVRRPHIATEIVSAMTQTSLPLGDLTVREVLRVTGHLRGMTRRDAADAAESLIERLGIAEVAGKLLNKTSGGQWRLASIATALIGDRPILVLDEPTNELDPTNRRMVWEYLRRLKQQEGRTIILVTHNVLEAERVVERVAIMHRGRIIALGTPGELKEQVDRRIRLEISLAPGAERPERDLALLGEVIPITDRHLVVLVPRGDVEAAVSRVVHQIGLERLDDFRILTPSLEDVYIEITGEAMEEAA
ncbi:MAG TPA: ABC transporter ATP-binding protein [Chloroflexota bacterium]|nr:ABC transporter ATP-binding protein [Chloroflexota bacterium]